MAEKQNNNKKIIIIGAGPSGLSCAYYILQNTDIKPIIIEESQHIGGISATVDYKGNRIDFGGHRFFTKNADVMKLWQEIFPIQDAPSKDEILTGNADNKYKETHVYANPEKDEKIFLKRRRISRIYFQKKFFDYPISIKPQTFINMGLLNVLKVCLSYFLSCIFKRKEKSLEDFYINRFGSKLYEMFFRDYTQKVWGVHPAQIAPDWGSQRVKGLSIISVIKHSLFKFLIKKEKEETSLIEEFIYPKRGPGQFYEAMADKIIQMGGTIILNNKVIGIEFTENIISSVKTVDSENNEHNYECDALFSSMPVKDLILAFNKEVEQSIRETAINLPYRDFITVGLLVNKLAVKNRSKYKTYAGIIPDCWIYIQEKNVKIGRLQIFNNWSPYMVKDFENTVWLGLEYFCSENDELWNTDEKNFINMASEELIKIGLINKADILDSVLIKVKKAYPAYFGTYKNFDIVKKYLNSIDNLYCIGRNGQHRYNNMDHSILSGIYAAKTFINGSDKEEIWNVNTENAYHEKA